MAHLVTDLDSRSDLIFAKRLIGERLDALGEAESLAEMAEEAVGRIGTKGRSVLRSMLEHYDADERFTLKVAAQHLQKPYPELKDIMYRSIGRVLDDPLIHKRWSGTSNEYWFGSEARDALLAALE
jgi:hypothetical protein